MKLTPTLAVFTFILLLVSCNNDEVVREILVEDEHAIDYLALSENSELLYYISNNKITKYDFNTNTLTTLEFNLTTLGSVLDMWTNENGDQLYLVSQKLEYPKLINMVTRVNPATLESEMLLDSIMGTSMYGELLQPVLHQKDYISFVKAMEAIASFTIFLPELKRQRVQVHSVCNSQPTAPDFFSKTTVKNLSTIQRMERSTISLTKILKT